MILPTTPMLFSSSHHSSFYRFRRNPAEFDMKNRPGRLICTYYTYRGESNHVAHVFAKTSRISEEQKVFAASPPQGIPRRIPPGEIMSDVERHNNRPTPLGISRNGNPPNMPHKRNSLARDQNASKWGRLGPVVVLARRR